MTECDALLAAVIAHPDDDTPRLVFADHLEDAGEVERAEFIRVQCELAKFYGPADNGLADNGLVPLLSPGTDEGPLRPLVRRERELLDVAAAEGWAGLPGFVDEWWFRRGFVDEVRLSAADWLAHADAILAAHPVRAVSLTTAPWLEPVRGGLYARLLGRAKELACGVGRRGRQLVEDLLRAEWPSVQTWALPPNPAVVGRLLRVLRDYVDERGRLMSEVLLNPPQDAPTPTPDRP